MEYQEKTDKLVNGIKQYSDQIGGFAAVYGDMVASCDGVGTKILLAKQAYKKFQRPLNSIGIDCVAMVVNDLICKGANPQFFLDYFAADYIREWEFEQVLAGIHEGCSQAGMELIGGETAELDKVIAYDAFDVCGFGVGRVNYPLPRNIQKGDCVIGLYSTGFHSNGYSLIRKHVDVLKADEELVNKLLEPTKIYVDDIDKIKKLGITINALAHITGGGWDNIYRVLPEGTSIDWVGNEYPYYKPLFKWIEEKANLTYKQMFSTFNCGIGMMVVIPNDHLKRMTGNNWIFLGSII